MTSHDGSAAVAKALRSSPRAPDDMRRARMERRIVAAATGAAVTGGRPTLREPPASRRWPYAVAGGLVVAAAAAAWLVVSGGVSSESASLASFEVRCTGASAPDADGTMQAGGSLAVGAGQEATLRVAHAEVRLGSGGRMLLRSASLEQVEIELASGEVEVAFHPQERGREHLTVVTAAARVEVVGTVFTVRVADDGTTHVATREGIVRVVPRGAGEASILVRAGEHTEVAPARREIESDGEAGAMAEGEEPMDFALAETEAALAETLPPSRELEGGSAPRELEGESAPREPTPQERFEEARALAEEGHHTRAQSLLRALTRGGVPLDVRVEAQSALGDSLAATGDAGAAAEAYRHAATLGGGSVAGLNALYMLARHEERALHDADAARADYLRYLERAPEGPLARPARAAICRLGGAEGIDCE